MKNTIPWSLWSVFTLSLLLTTRNPLYLLIVAVNLLILGQSISNRKDKPFSLKGNLRFLLTMVAISAVINTFFAHTGKTVIFSLPDNWLLVGGDITLESFVFGVINGLIIGSLYLVFNILNLALSTKQMTRLIPAALKPIAMTITVALTFFPSVQQRAREIKEAQMIRGNPMKRVADWMPLIIPLLITSLEKAFLLAESMTSRGFHTPRTSARTERLLIGMVLGTFAVFSGWILRLFDYPLPFSILLYVFGGLIFVYALWHSHQSASITRYHHEECARKDIAASGLFSLGIISMIVLQITQQPHSFSYSPYPELSVPGFQWGVLMMLLLSLSPVIFITHD